MEDLQNLSNNVAEEEVKLREKINLRREARRRKILENAKSRLEKLNGRTTTDQQQQCCVPNIAEKYEFSDPEVEPNVVPERVPAAALQSDYSDLLSSFTSEVSTSNTQKRHVMLRCRVHILLSALLSFALALLWKEGGSNGFSIFLPAGLCVITDLLYFREQHQVNPFTTLLITISGIQSQKANHMLKVFSIVQSLIVDIGFFVFCFCTFTCIVFCINDSLANVVVIK